MSNYNEVLTANNADLQSILDAVNALPEASSGSVDTSVELVTFTCSASNFEAGTAEFLFYDETSNQWSFCKSHYSYNHDKTIYKVPKNGFLSVTSLALWSFSPTSAIEVLDERAGVIKILSDVSATFD